MIASLLYSAALVVHVVGGLMFALAYKVTRQPGDLHAALSVALYSVICVVAVFRLTHEAMPGPFTIMATWLIVLMLIRDWARDADRLRPAFAIKGDRFRRWVARLREWW